MPLLIVLISLLIIAIVFFITYPIFKRKIVYKKYDVFCSKKIRIISQKNHLKYLTNLNINSSCGAQSINSIIFGNKYIYILFNILFDGDIKGEPNDNSWILQKRTTKNSEYIDNISNLLSEKRAAFSEKITANPELIIPIAIVNNDCDINVSNINNNSTFIVHFSSLKKLIRKIESRNIANLDKEQINNVYENLKYENECN